jgi:site-specific DNA recombinase
VIRQTCRKTETQSNALIEKKDYFTDKWNEKKNDENILVRYKSQQFIDIIKEAKVLIEFDIDIYFKVIEKMVVFEGNKIIVTLHN